MELEWLFCYLNTAERAQDLDWREEAEALEELGMNSYSFDYENFLSGNIDQALQDLPEGDGKRLVYRGWMMPEDDYLELETAITDRGYQLVVSAYEYSHTFSLPNYFEHIEDLTPPALWTEGDDIDEAWELAKSFGDGKGPWIVKDYLKSAKEAWLEATFIPRDADFETFKSVCEELWNRRAPDFTGGYVVRPFVQLKEQGASWRGGPIFEEYRLIFWNGELIFADDYNGMENTEQPASETVDFSKFEILGDRIDSPFFVADVARKEDGELILIEINPGGCAGLPPGNHPIELFEAIAKAEDLL